MRCGIHVAHRGQLLRSVHPALRKHDHHALRGGNDELHPIDHAANAIFIFTASYFATAFLLALGADELVVSGFTTIVFVFTRYLHFVNRAAYGVAGRLLGVLGALRGLLFHRPGPAADHPARAAAARAAARMDRADDRDYFWNGQWLPF